MPYNKDRHHQIKMRSCLLAPIRRAMTDGEGQVVPLKQPGQVGSPARTLILETVEELVYQYLVVEIFNSCLSGTRTL